jgi:ubiquinone/menaquinone biosynthesis C-methylase UbiE
VTTRDPRSHSSERFGRFAERYVASATHASGDDLDLLLQIAAPQPDWSALDIATGGGHTALKLAPHLRAVIAADIALPMLDKAREFHTSKTQSNITYIGCDAEALPFPAHAFDLVTCRIAPHHFPHAERFVMDAARVLKPGGRLIVQDHLLPDDRKAAAYIESFERLRDLSHHRAFDEYQWRGMFLDAELSIEQVHILRRRAQLLPWARIQDCTPAVIERLHILLARAPAAVAEHLQPQCATTTDASFDHVYVLIAGRKALA